LYLFLVILLLSFLFECLGIPFKYLDFRINLFFLGIRLRAESISMIQSRSLKMQILTNVSTRKVYGFFIKVIMFAKFHYFFLFLVNFLNVDIELFLSWSNDCVSFLALLFTAFLWWTKYINLPLFERLINIIFCL
jgi:hypothetical protein